MAYRSVAADRDYRMVTTEYVTPWVPLPCDVSVEIESGQLNNRERQSRSERTFLPVLCRRRRQRLLRVSAGSSFGLRVTRPLREGTLVAGPAHYPSPASVDSLLASGLLTDERGGTCSRRRNPFLRRGSSCGQSKSQNKLKSQNRPRFSGPLLRKLKSQNRPASWLRAAGDYPMSRDCSEMRSARDAACPSGYTWFMDSGEHRPTPLVGSRPHLRVVPRPAEGAAADEAADAKVRNRKSLGSPVPGRPSDPGVPTPLSEAYVFGARLLVDQPAACRVGYRLFFVHNRDLGWIDLEASSTVYAVLGWHDNCDLQLPKLPGIANRQLLASCSLLADGTPALRLLDLQTGQPFTIDGQPRQSISVSGPLLIGLGEHRCALGCVPLPEFHQQRGALGTAQELPAYDTSEAEMRSG